MRCFAGLKQKFARKYISTFRISLVAELTVKTCNCIHVLYLFCTTLQVMQLSLNSTTDSESALPNATIEPVQYMLNIIIRSDANVSNHGVAEILI